MHNDVSGKLMEHLPFVNGNPIGDGDMDLGLCLRNTIGT